MQTVKRERRVLHFFSSHAWLLTDPRFSSEGRREIAVHRRSLASAQRYLASHRRTTKRKRLARRLASAKAETPASTVCRVFGSYCAEALQVARCESGLHTDAHNGQYLGLFQMGTAERQLFGHGNSAEEQARAALRYFISSGRDWSRWSCRPL
jgi:hypothetical protein